MNEMTMNSACMYDEVEGIRSLNRVEGFDPRKYMRLIQNVIPHFIYFQIHCTSVKFNKAPVSNKLTFIASDSLIPGRCMLS